MAGKRLTILAALAASSLAGAAHGQAPSTPDDMQFRGTVGGYPVGVDLTVEADKVASGYYFYVSKLADIRLEPRDEGDGVTLAGADGSIMRLHFVGNGSEHGQPLGFANSVGLEGSWTQGSRTLPVRLQGDGASGSGKPGHRYALITDAPDAVVEGHARQFLHGVLSGDRAQAAAAVDYPLRVNGPGAKRAMIRDKAQLLARWDAIFTPRFLSVLRTAVPHDMFVRDQGAMVAQGAVWFSGKGASALNVDTAPP